MKNIQFVLEDQKLIVIVDLSREFGRSSSGKSLMVASTEGNIPLPGHEEIKIGINIYRPVSKEDRS